jgi:hypothetical protein
MKMKLAASLLAAAALCGHALADTFSLNIQYGLPTGFSSQWTELNTGGCAAVLSQGYTGCVTIPLNKAVRQCTGTQTIKVPSVELLARIICGTTSQYELIWVGHHLTSLYGGSNQPGLNTVHISTPVLPNDPLLTGDGVKACWVEYQAGNGGPTTPPGGGWEIQTTCTAE